MILRSFLLFAAALVVAADDLVLDFRAGNSKLGVFYQGDQTDTSVDLETDVFKGFVTPYGHNTQYVKTGEGFFVRSADFDLRVKIIVWKNTDYKTAEEYPYKITMKNCVMDNAVEIKLSDKGGYQWIEPGTYITQLSDIQHDYVFRDSTGNTKLAIRLFPPAERDL